uniref:Acyl-CoA-binding domain-containing protein 3 n=1 Tax=Noccaea caerulescens TaxID=107243 RepID=A0A1J3J0G3_NOCCA
MEFFLEMLRTAAVALLFSFLVAKFVSVATAGNRGNDPTSDQSENPEIGVGDAEELRFGMKLDAPLIGSVRNFQAVDENVEAVDRFGSKVARVVEPQEAAKGEELVVPTAEAESSAAATPENIVAEESIVRGKDERRGYGEEISGKICDQHEESTASISPENVVGEEIVIRGQEKQSESAEGVGEVVVDESEEVRVEESNTVEESENKMELNTEEENEEKEELSIEEDDDWEGIERSELEKAFAAAVNFLEESGKAEEIGAEAKMELYGLHKIATEGSCREAQPMALMVSARAKWNAWQKLGNMSQEEAMEQYLALLSKEIPAFMNTVGKMPEMENSVISPSNSGSLEDVNTLDTTGCKNVSGESSV